jgi:hypothetical protein
VNTRRITTLAMIKDVARRLGPLRDRVAFLGGAATVLLVTDPATPEVRPARDVDVIAEISSKIEAFRGRGKGDFASS